MRHITFDKYKKHLDPLLSKLNNDPMKDWISHFVLRLAYCRTEDLRRWFLTQEVALLKYRLNNQNTSSTKNGNTSAITKALKSVLPNAHVSTPEELEPILPKILAATPSLNMNPLQVAAAGGRKGAVVMVTQSIVSHLHKHWTWCNIVRYILRVGWHIFLNRSYYHWSQRNSVPICLDNWCY